MEILAFILMLGTLLLVYFLPSVIANARKHRNLAAIIGLNAVAGWTVLGWIVAFVWALTNNRED